ncbi:cystatin C [Rhinolophus ferrumequinum]|uniref:Cystatin C n=1 Tax=Rhinolophus ferrumequinum TaxID=59479 RepID=A0A7J7S7P5_RHIFE|nr:cystatin C [Rhinolophus ferrumequinum]
MAGSLRTPLLLLAALTLALALAMSPTVGASPSKLHRVGGLLDADVNEEGVQQALNFALSEYNKASNDAFHSRAMRKAFCSFQIYSVPWLSKISMVKSSCQDA